VADELKEIPQSGLQRLTGRVGRGMQKVGRTMEQATEPLSENYPIRTALSNLFLTSPLQSVGAAMQDYSGTPRDATEDYPYRARLFDPGKASMVDPRIIDALDMAQLSSPIVKGGKKVAKAVGKEAGRRIDEAMMTGEGMLGKALSPVSPMYVVKPKGGNWIEGAPEKAVKGLQRGVKPQDVRDIEFLKLKLSHDLKMGNVEDAERLQKSIARREEEMRTPLNDWIEKQLARYYRNELATPEDPVRALAEKGILHFDPEPYRHVYGGQLSKRREAAGYPLAGMADSPLGKAWEAQADRAISSQSAQEAKAISKRLGSRPPDWMEKLDPNAQIYGASLTYDKLGFNHLIDELGNAISPHGDLPPELRIRPESLSKLSVPQAVERVAKINAWREKQAAEALKAAREGIPVHKEYPEGYQWMAVPDTEADERALKYAMDIGCEGGWCTKGEDLAREYGGGGNRLYALHDPKGKVVAQIRTSPNQKEYLDTDEVVERFWNTHGREPSSRQELLEFDNQHPVIGEIKGRLNRPPSPELLPYVQDFVRSGKWSRIDDLENAGLFRADPNELGMIMPANPALRNLPGRRTDDLLKAQQAGLFGDKQYVTRQEYEDILRQQIESESGPLPPTNDMKKGGAVKPSDASQDAMQMQVWNKQVQGKAAGGLSKGVKAVKKMVEEGSSSRFTPKRVQTVSDPQRMAFPGIYQRPDVIASEAASRVAPEDPALKQIFGVTREDLYQLGKSRQGNLPGDLPGQAAKPRGSEAAANVMTRRNRQRILDVNAEAEKHPLLVQGMDPWYVMDPLFKRMAELMGPEKAKIEYLKMNTLMGMASPGSEVLTEIPRGTAAYFLQKQGRFPEFVEHLGKPEGLRGDVPSDIINVPGHMYHQTAQATPMSQYLESGELQMKSPKVPMYIQASQVPEIGFQTRTPVGDAHWSRAVGLADTRGARTIKGKEAVPGASVSNPEMTQLAPWWREQIANELGIESVPAQARTWGVFSGQTGVTTPIGAPKLELLAQKIMETAQRLNVSPETARDMVIMGDTYAGKKDGGAVNMAEGGQSRQPVDRSLPDLGFEERLRMEDYLRRMRFTGGGSGDKYGTGVGGRAMLNFPVGPAVVQPYVGGGVYKPQGGKLTGGVSEAGVNLVIPFANGGEVSADDLIVEERPL
jgi:hypothetical protein